MSQTAALPPVSRQAMSLLPSPLKSWELTVVSAQRAIWLVASSTNHSAPSGPIVITAGLSPAQGMPKRSEQPTSELPARQYLACPLDHQKNTRTPAPLAGAPPRGQHYRNPPPAGL